jgi:NAD(P)-dependent dehydrogenase (short-subunit alcohol dehydrogenase family)
VGAAAVEAFLREGWEVVALSRRAPEIAGSQAFTHLAVDLQDAAASRAALGALSLGGMTLALAVLQQGQRSLANALSAFAQVMMSGVMP